MDVGDTFAVCLLSQNGDYFKMRLKFLRMSPCTRGSFCVLVQTPWRLAWGVGPRVASACEDGPAHVFQEEIFWRRSVDPLSHYGLGVKLDVSYMCGVSPFRLSLFIVEKFKHVQNRESV